MASKFGKNYPVLAGKNDKDKVLFFAAALLALSLVVIFIMIVNVKNSGAKEYPTPVQATAPIEIGTVTLYAPDRPVRGGTALSGVQFKEVYWPRNQVPDGAIRDVSEIQALYSKQDLNPGVPILRSHVTNEQTQFTLPVTPGNRAVSIEVDATGLVEGWVAPGTRVDVVLTAAEPDGRPSSSIIVQNARILSVAGDTNNAQRRQGAAIAQVRAATVTLDVSTEDALKIQTARQLGRLSLLLRDDRDNNAPQKQKVISTDVTESKDAKGSAKRQDCPNRGMMKMGGRQYAVNCHGELMLIDDSEP